jgi:ferric-dicitrate binding protein FerR (iron transport regulator)
MTPSELESAIQGAFDGTLGTSDCRELREILKTDSAARALYFEHASIHQLLIYRFAVSQPLKTARPPVNARLRLHARRNVRFVLAIAAVLVLALGLALKPLLAPKRLPLAVLKKDAGTLCSVEQELSGGKAAPNELHENALVRLTQGSLEVTFRNGARTIVLAPATFRIVSDKHVKLQEGTAWFDVGENGKGLQVTTPAMNVTDLGTRFGVTVRPEKNDEVHVFSGQVVAQSLSPLHSEESLTTGMARVCDPAGGFKAVDLRPEEFLTSLPAHSDPSQIINGNFESGSPPPAITYGAHATAALVPGWRFGREITVVRATSEGIPGYGERGITILSSTADTQVGFNSDTDGRPSAENVSLYQTFATTPGREYVVQFEMGAIFFQATRIEITAAVYDGAAADGLPTSPALGSRIEHRELAAGNGYNPPARFTFTATSESSILVFTETSARSISADPVIDNISVKAK